MRVSRNNKDAAVSQKPVFPVTRHVKTEVYAIVDADVFVDDRPANPDTRADLNVMH
jgi:hypothetical protein